MSDDFKTIDDLNLTSIHIDENVKKEYSNRIKEKLSTNIRCKSKINPLLKDEDTFNNSIADIDEYLQDEEICSLCVNGLKECPKKIKGYILNPKFDEYFNRIAMDKVPCKYLVDKLKALDKITPCNVSKEYIYQTSSQLLKNIQTTDGDKTYKDSKTLVYTILKLYKQFSIEKKNQGIVFYSINDDHLASNILRFACYLFASKGYRCSYIRLEDLFDNLKDFEYVVKDNAEHDLRIMASVPVLCLEDINLLQKRFYKEEMFVKYLYPLIKARNENGKITFASLSQDKTVSQVSNSWFYKMDQQADATNIMENLFVKKKIKDIII